MGLELEVAAWFLCSLLLGYWARLRYALVWLGVCVTTMTGLILLMRFSVGTITCLG